MLPYIQAIEVIATLNDRSQVVKNSGTKNMTHQEITTRLKRHLNCTLWQKKGTRLYINNEGYNTRKCVQKLYIDLDRYEVRCFTDCPSQPTEWCVSQSALLTERFQKFARYARLLSRAQ